MDSSKVPKPVLRRQAPTLFFHRPFNRQGASNPTAQLQGQTLRLRDHRWDRAGWSDPLHALVDQETVPDGDPERSALVCECMRLGLSPILEALLAGFSPSTLILQGNIDALGLKTLLDAIPGDGCASKSLAVIAPQIDEDGCHLLLAVLHKLKAKTLSLDVRLQEPHLRLDHGFDFHLCSLEVKLPAAGGRISPLLDRLVPRSSQLREVSIVCRGGDLQEHEQIGAMIHLHGQVHALSVSLPSPAHLDHLLGYCQMVKADTLNSLSITCETPGPLDLDTCELWGKAMHGLNLKQISLRNWTSNRFAGASNLLFLVRALGSMKGLARVDLRNNQGLDDEDLQFIFLILQNNPSLRALDLRGTTSALFRCDGLGALLEHSRTLTDLALPDLSPFFNIEQLAQALRRNTSLLRFDVRYSGLARNEIFLAETVAACARRNEPAHWRMLFQSGLSTLYGNGLRDREGVLLAEAIRDEAALPEEISAELEQAGLDLVSGARLTLIDHRAQRLAHAAKLEWERRQRTDKD